MNRRIVFRQRHRLVQTKLIGFNMWNRSRKK